MLLLIAPNEMNLNATIEPSQGALRSWSNKRAPKVWGKLQVLSQGTHGPVTKVLTGTPRPGVLIHTLGVLGSEDSGRSPSHR